MREQLRTRTEADAAANRQTQQQRSTGGAPQLSHDNANLPAEHAKRSTLSPKKAERDDKQPMTNDHSDNIRQSGWHNKYRQR
jgi:hypothetical protein